MVTGWGIACILTPGVSLFPPRTLPLGSSNNNNTFLNCTKSKPGKWLWYNAINSDTGLILVFKYYYVMNLWSKESSKIIIIITKNKLDPMSNVPTHPKFITNNTFRW